MLRGLLAGGVWGAVIAVVVLALTSQVADWRDLTPAITEDVASAEPGVGLPAAEADAPSAVPGSETRIVESPLPNVTPGDTEAVAAPSLETAPPASPEAPAAIAGRSAPAEDVDIAAAPAPDTGVSAPAPLAAAPAPALPRTVPQPEPLIRNRVSTGDTPVAPTAPPVTAAPDAPQDRSAPQLAQRSVQRPAPIPSGGTTPPSAESATAPAPEVPTLNAAPATDAPDEDTAIALAEATRPVAPAPAPSEPVRPEADQIAVADTTPAAPAMRVTQRETPRVTTIRVNQLPTIAVPAETPPAPAPADGTAAADPAPATEAEAQLAAVTPDPGTAETPPALPGQATGTSLPGQSVTGLPGDATATETAEGTRPAGFELDVLSDLALERNAADFTAEPDEPLVSVILVDTGAAQLDASQIEALPFPITMGVDAAAENARDLAQTYRGAGSEVALIPTLPIDGRAQDMAMALSFNIDVVPVAVAIMDATGSDFQTDRTATTEVVAAAASSGHGIVTHARGLNSSRTIAAQAGVPAGQVFRAIDPELTDARAIGRFLDQAAFRARRDGSVILVMPARQDMLSALLAWSFQPRSSTVTLAPLSAILRGSGA
ncbi:MAG: divergent polysaccharide deacetylase family protein [Pseudomonadota bacterium]